MYYLLTCKSLLCSGHGVTGCGRSRVSWCRHLRVSRRNQPIRKEGPRHTSRGMPSGIPRRTHYDDSLSVALLERSCQTWLPARSASPASGRPASTRSVPSPATAAVPIRGTLSARARLVDHKRAAFEVLAVHRRDRVGGLLRGDFHESESPGGDEPGLSHRSPRLKKVAQILFRDVVGKVPHVQTLRGHHQLLDA